MHSETFSRSRLFFQINCRLIGRATGISDTAGFLYHLGQQGAHNYMLSLMKGASWHITFS